MIKTASFYLKFKQDVSLRRRNDRATASIACFFTTFSDGSFPKLSEPPAHTSLYCLFSCFGCTRQIQSQTSKSRMFYIRIIMYFNNSNNSKKLALSLFGAIITPLPNEREENVNSKEIITKIEKDGWELVAVRGSHHQFKHPSKPGRVTVPHPKKDLNIKTVKSILKQAGLE